MFGRRLWPVCSTMLGRLIPRSGRCSVQSLSRVWHLRPHGLQHARLPCPSLHLKYLSDIVVPRPDCRPEPSGMRKRVSGPFLPFHASYPHFNKSHPSLWSLAFVPLSTQQCFSPGKALLSLRAPISIPHRGMERCLLRPPASLSIRVPPLPSENQHLSPLQN